MEIISPNNPRTHLHRYLTAAYILFIAYVSLSPFTGWKEQGLSFSDVLTAPLTQTFTGFDFSLNILAYLPFGFLLAYMMRDHRSVPRVMFLSTLSGLVMSLSMEYAQMYLPTRVSSNTDLISNVLGTFIGAIIALIIVRHSWFSRVKVLPISRSM